MRLSESVVVLTGASGGIGLQLAEQLCAAGARVLAVSRHMGKLAGLMNRYPDRLRWQTADLRTQEGREQVRRGGAGHGQAGDLAVGGGCQRQGQSAQTGGEDEALDRSAVAGGDVAAAGVADRQGAARRLYRRDRGVVDPAPLRGLDVMDIGRQGGVRDDGGEGFGAHAAAPSSTLRNRWVRCRRSPPMRSN